MKKTKLLLALCLASYMGYAQIVTNGGFETYSTLPTTCPSYTDASTIGDVSSWTFGTYQYNYTGSCLGGINGGLPYMYLRGFYYNNSTGGTGSCEPISPYSGNGYVTLQGSGYEYHNTNAGTVYISQSVGTLYSGGTYLFTCYAYTGGNYAAANVYADLSTSSGDIPSSAPTPTITGSSGWVQVQVLLSVPSNGTYYLNIGGNPTYNFCWPGGYFYSAIDEVSLVEQPCPANAGSNVSATALCNGSGTATIGTASVTNMSYSWTPATALSCTNCAQPVASYSAMSASEIYTVTVSGSGCTTNTSTVSVTYPTMVSSIGNTSTFTGSNITVVGNYTTNFTPAYYYWSITQCTATGGTVTPAFTENNGWGPLESSGYTYTFPNTSTLTCNTYYIVQFGIGSNSCANYWPSTIVETTLPTGGPNEINQESDCGSWPGVTIGNASVTGMSYTWSPNTDLSSTTIAQPTSTWTTTSSPEIYTLTVSESGCTSVTSTVQVTAQTCGANCGNGCRTAAIQALSNGTGTIVHMAVYPNPANGNVTVGLYSAADYIRITDMQGRTVFETQSTDAGELKLDISNYTKGMYFVVAKIGNAIEKQKLVVE